VLCCVDDLTKSLFPGVADCAVVVVCDVLVTCFCACAVTDKVDCVLVSAFVVVDDLVIEAVDAVVVALDAVVMDTDIFADVRPVVVACKLAVGGLDCVCVALSTVFTATDMAVADDAASLCVSTCVVVVGVTLCIVVDPAARFEAVSLSAVNMVDGDVSETLQLHLM